MTDDPLALEQQVCFALSRASRAVIGAHRPVLEPLGLTHPQYLVMLAMWERRRQSLKELSTALALEPATLSPLVRRLESFGHVTRRRDDADERTLVIELTDQGLALRERARAVPLVMMERLGLKLTDVETQRDLLNLLITASAAAPEVTDAQLAMLSGADPVP
ncbi:MarR family winged helix-turn-helix transcriptional regulator [Rudaeicoccus suwonensis]|uniref:DNA-binding MarR family transcriptional regulator n=1 Tax=Rudaeicoccus suwonensis TaxID=657409 RepID=A0A561EAP7_9MICO|nr:MarR family transcriptional regulator [Rudaeicoccus suwonensis]TWE12681.1 DNA-binding MarR family transcriptional regulator [Rudaeicoccus suwonensis]